MFRNHLMTPSLGSGGAPSTSMFTKMKGMFSNFKMTYLLYFLALLLFILVAYYFYSSYVSPKMAPVYNNSASNGSGSGSKGGKEAEIMLFYVDWCPHCKTAKPAWEEVKASYEHKMINGYHVTFTEINCTEETAEVEELIKQYHIEGYPTIKLVKEGQVIEFDAKPTKSTLEQFLNTVL